MKKILIFALILGLVTQLNAQRPGGPPPGGQRPQSAAPPSNALSKEADAALKNYEKIKTDVMGKKASDAASWVKFGNSILTVYEHPSKNIWVGLSALEARVVLKDQRSSGSESVSLNGDDYEVTHYPDKDLYYDQNGTLSFWVVTKPLLQGNLLNDAYQAFLKGYELDVKGSQKKSISEGILKIQNQHITEAMSANSIGNASLSSAHFGHSIICSEHPLINKIDTVVVFYTGLTAFYAQEYERSINYLQRSLNMGYTQDGAVYSYLAESYKAIGQPEKEETILSEGFTKYPSNQGILVALINMYRDREEDPAKIMEYIHKAQEFEPNNESLYNAEGDIWKKLNNTEKALECYQKAIQVNPNYMYGYINIGVTYYDTVVELQTLASEEMDDRKYNAIIDEADALLEKAIDPFETAFNLTENHDIKADIALYLKNIFYRLQRIDESKYAASYEKYMDYIENR